MPRFGLKPSKWQNPFKRPSGAPPGSTLAQYEQYVLSQPQLMQSLHELEGKVLACWCKPNPCHGDVLRRLVAAQNMDPFEIALADQNTALDEEWHFDGSSSNRPPLRVVTSGAHVDAIVIEVTHLSDTRRCVMAMTPNGVLFRPLVENGFDAAHPLAGSTRDFRSMQTLLVSVLSRTATKMYGCHTLKCKDLPNIRRCWIALRGEQPLRVPLPLTWLYCKRYNFDDT